MYGHYTIEFWMKKTIFIYNFIWTTLPLILFRVNTAQSTVNI